MHDVVCSRCPSVQGRPSRGVGGHAVTAQRSRPRSTRRGRSPLVRVAVLAEHHDRAACSALLPGRRSGRVRVTRPIPTQWLGPGSVGNGGRLGRFRGIRRPGRSPRSSPQPQPAVTLPPRRFPEDLRGHTAPLNGRSVPRIAALTMTASTSSSPARRGTTWPPAAGTSTSCSPPATRLDRAPRRRCVRRARSARGVLGGRAHREPEGIWAVRA